MTSQLALIFALGCLLIGCRSKSNLKPDSESPAQLHNFVFLGAQVAYSPRRNQELQNVILVHPSIQECLRLEPSVLLPDFVVGIEGQMDYRGAIARVRVKTASVALKDCLAREVQTIVFGRGRSGPFKMKVVRLAPVTGENASPEGIKLSLTPAKKWDNPRPSP